MNRKREPKAEGMTLRDVLSETQRQRGMGRTFYENMNVELRMSDGLKISKVKFIKKENAVYLVDFDG